MTKRGFFITLEGPEGSGKTTQARLLAGALKRRGTPVILTREPGGSRVSEAIRRLLLHTAKRLHPLTELLLYQAARAQHVRERILPALRKGYVVICDRFSDATLAYQGYGRGLDRPLIQALNKIASQGRGPDLTFLLDLPAREGLRRARRKGKPDRLEGAGLRFHKKVRWGYLAIARRERVRIRVIRPKNTPWETHFEIRRMVDRLLSRRGTGP